MENRRMERGFFLMEQETRGRRGKGVVILWILCLLFAIGFTVLFIHGHYARRILNRLGIVSQVVKEDFSILYDLNTVDAWERCLEQLDVDADVVFIGDSLTYFSDFTRYFPEKKICNLGINGDTLQGLNVRVSMIRAVNPEKVFLLGGINSLRDARFDAALKEYEQLVNHMCRLLDAEIYLISVLPIASYRAVDVLANDTITRFNQKLAELAEKKGIVHIDAASGFLLNGEMNPAYTIDGVHLSQAGYDVWADQIAAYMDSSP